MYVGHIGEYSCTYNLKYNPISLSHRLDVLGKRELINLDSDPVLNPRSGTQILVRTMYKYKYFHSINKHIENLNKGLLTEFSLTKMLLIHQSWCSQNRFVRKRSCIVFVKKLCTAE